MILKCVNCNTFEDEDGISIGWTGTRDVFYNCTCYNCGFEWEQW